MKAAPDVSPPIAALTQILDFVSPRNHQPRVVVAALRNRLGAAIAKDWLAAAGLAADRHNTDARTRAARPTNIDEFQERWGSVSDVSDGRCTPHPRKLETEMEPD